MNGRQYCAEYATFAAALFALSAFLLIGFGDTSAKASVSISDSPACASIQPSLSLVATAAYAKDLTTGKILYAKNADSQLPLASLTKLMTVATAADVIGPDDTVTISRQALAPEGDAGFVIGERWTASALIGYTLLVSANDGAHAIALAAAEKEGSTAEGFIQQMNAKAATLGMRESFFTSDTGLDISSTTAGAYGSARDIATVLAYLVKNNPALVEGTRDGSKTFTSLSGIAHHGENTSDVIEGLPGAIASKTGYTDLAGGNLAVVFEPMPGHAVAAVVLGSTRDGRTTDMQVLAEGAKKALKRMLLCADGAGSP